MEKTLSEAVLDGVQVLNRARDGAGPGLSSSGADIRCLAVSARGEVGSYDAESLLVFGFGHAIEEVVVNALIAGGVEVADRQRHVNLSCDAPGLTDRKCWCGAFVPAGAIPGHVDGTVAGGHVLIDAKSSSEFGFKKVLESGEADDRYVAQMVAYLAAFRDEAGNGEVIPEYGKLVFVNKGAAKGKIAVAEVDVDYDEARVLWLREKWRRVYESVLTGRLPDPEFPPDYWYWRYCPHVGKCLHAPDRAPRAAT